MWVGCIIYEFHFRTVKVVFHSEKGIVGLI